MGQNPKPSQSSLNSGLLAVSEDEPRSSPQAAVKQCMVVALTRTVGKHYKAAQGALKLQRRSRRRRSCVSLRSPLTGLGLGSSSLLYLPSLLQTTVGMNAPGIARAGRLHLVHRSHLECRCGEFQNSARFEGVFARRGDGESSMQLPRRILDMSVPLLDAETRP